MNRSRFTPAALAAALVALFAMPAKAQTGPIDGLWESVSTPDAASIKKGAREFKENVLIENSLATREVFSKYGFGPTPSSILNVSPVVTYKTVYTDSKFGTLTVNGNLSATLTSVTGTMTWNRADGTVWSYSFTMTKTGPVPVPPVE